MDRSKRYRTIVAKLFVPALYKLKSFVPDKPTRLQRFFMWVFGTSPREPLEAYLRQALNPLLDAMDDLFPVLPLRNPYLQFKYTKDNNAIGNASLIAPAPTDSKRESIILLEFGREPYQADDFFELSSHFTHELVHWSQIYCCHHDRYIGSTNFLRLVLRHKKTVEVRDYLAIPQEIEAWAFTTAATMFFAAVTKGQNVYDDLRIGASEYTTLVTYQQLFANDQKTYHRFLKLVYLWINAFELEFRRGIIVNDAGGYIGGPR